MKTLLTSLSLLLVTTAAVAWQDDTFKLDETYAMSPTGTIDLRASDARVTITGTNRKDARIRVDRKETAKGLVRGNRDFRVEVLPENGNLKIREYQSSVNVTGMGWYSEDYRIAIEAPEGASLRVNGDDGTYIITNIDGDISLDLDDADAQLTGCSGNAFRFRTDDGDIVMDEGRGRLDITADDGDVEIRNGQFTGIRAGVDDGDLRITTSLTNGGDYRLDAQDGLVELTITGGGGVFDISHDDAQVQHQGNFAAQQEDEHRTRLRLEGGTAQVRIQADDAGVKLMAAR